MRRAALGVMLAALISGVTDTGFAQKPSSPQTLENLLQEEKPDGAAKVEETAEADGDSQPVRPAGTYVRPKDGYKHPDLDNAWADYDTAMKNATAELRDAIANQRTAARKAGNLEEAKRYKAMLELLDKKGQLPADDKSLQKSIQAVENAYKSAAAALEKSYKGVVAKLVSDISLDESVAEAVSIEQKNLKPNKAITSPNGKPVTLKKQIPKDAIKIGRQRYYIYVDEVTQAEAVVECKKRGGYLARLTQPIEFAEFNRRMLAFRRECAFWCDGSDAINEGTWTHLNGDPLPRVPWVSGEPNDAFPGEDGLTINARPQEGGFLVVGFNDDKTSSRHGFICEWDDDE